MELNAVEERMQRFAKQCRSFISLLPRTMANIDVARQLLKSSGSIAEHYTAAAQQTSDKDIQFRMRKARKEVDETVNQLKVLAEGNPKLAASSQLLIGEAEAIRKELAAVKNNGTSKQ
jgi:four helix bundle protein